MDYPLLLSVQSEEKYKLLLEYANKEQRVYDFKKHLEHPFYTSLKNEDLFKKVKVIEGELEWATGQDFCPNTLYEYSKRLNK